MKCFGRFLVVVLAALAGSLLVRQDSVSDEDLISRAKVNDKIPNLTFIDAKGKRTSLEDDYRNKKAIVIVFLSFDCPVSNSYCKPLSDMHKEFSDYGVGFIGLTANQDQTRAEVAKLAKKFDISFPVYLDKNFKAADTLKADVTPEVFVLDGDYILRYRGRIDNTWYARLKRNHQASCHELHQVLGELMSGRPVSVSATESVGCAIFRNFDEIPVNGPVTYYRDVLPILQNKCQTCHRPGEVGPFSLMTFKQAYNWAEDIKEYTRTRFMPPWKPSAGLPFHNERKLTQKEIDLLAKWADTGCAKGDPKEAPPSPKFVKGWQNGEPDLVLEMPAEFEVGPTGHDVFRCFVLPANLPEDKYVSGVEVRPGNPSVVHHALLFVDTKGQARKLEKQARIDEKNPTYSHHGGETDLDKGPGYTVAMGVGFKPQGSLGGWAPGIQARNLPSGYGYFLPKDSDVVLQVHYHRTGRTEKDKTRIGLYFADKEKMKPYQGAVLAGGSGNTGPLRLFFAIPPGAKRHRLTGSIWATEDWKLFSVMPHMHLLGKEIKVTMTPPDRKTTTLIHIKDWDYNWQETYFLKEPVHVKAGTRFDVEAYYDNSADNPHNPHDPPKVVTFGEETTNEMCFVFLGGGSENEGRRLPFTFLAPEEGNKKPH